MGEYIKGIVVSAAVFGLLGRLIPWEKTGRDVKLLTSLCLLCLLIKPVGAAISAVPELFSQMSEIAEEGEASREKYQGILEGEIQKTVQQQLKDAVAEELKARFGISNCEVGVALTREEGELKVDRLVVTLMGKDIFKNPHEIEDHFQALFSCPCIVVIA